MQLISTAELPPAALHAAFSEAFSDYVAGPFQLPLAQWEGFLSRQAADLNLGRAAVRGDELLAFALVAPRAAIGRWRLATMGARPAARGSGAAALLLDDLLARARQAGQQAVELEVFVQNPRAVRLYEKQGFERRHALLGYQLQKAPALAAASDAIETVSAEAALAWLQEAERRIPDLPLQVSATVVATLPAGWTAWRCGGAQLVFSLDAQAGVQLRSLIDPDPAQRDAETLVRACMAAHPGQSLAMPALQRPDLGGEALARCGFESPELHQQLMLRRL